MSKKPVHEKEILNSVIVEAQDIFPTNKAITIENLKEYLEQKKKGWIAKIEDDNIQFEARCILRIGVITLNEVLGDFKK